MGIVTFQQGISCPSEKYELLEEHLTVKECFTA
jgi:hypothetical protein